MKLIFFSGKQVFFLVGFELKSRKCCCVGDVEVMTSPCFSSVHLHGSFPCLGTAVCSRGVHAALLYQVTALHSCTS